MNNRVFVSLCVAAFGLLRATLAPAATADAQLESVFKAYLESLFQLQPSTASELGDHRFDHQLDEVSRASRAKVVNLLRTTLQELSSKVEVGALSAEGKIDYGIFRQDLARSIWLEENTHPLEEDARVYNGLLSDSVYTLLTQSTEPKETNISNCISRMSQMPRVIAAARENLKRPVRTMLETAIRQNQGAIQFYRKGIFEFAGSTRQARELTSAAQATAAALEEYQKFLEQLLPSAAGDWRLGKERFYRKLELVLDAGMTADQVLGDAQSEFDRVQRDMYVIARQLWSRYFPGLVLPPDDAAGRRTTVELVLKEIGRDHGKPENLVRDTRRTVAHLKKFICEKNILRLPEPDTCKIIEMPEFKRGNSTAYMASAPPLDPRATGFFAVSPPPKDWDSAKVNSFLEEYNRSMLQILTIHEAYPGHYVQLEYANRNPSLIRRVLSSGVYIEGWAVYTEQTMLDQGYGEGDLPLRMSQLKFYLRAVVNAILDHKMHCAGMTDEEAMDLLTRQAYQSEGEARLKVIRAKQSSVQLSTYFVGRMAHYRLRQAIQREMGDAFQLGRYHEAVLTPGAVPMKDLPGIVRGKLGLPANAALAQ